MIRKALVMLRSAVQSCPAAPVLVKKSRRFTRAAFIVPTPETRTYREEAVPTWGFSGDSVRGTFTNPNGPPGQMPGPGYAAKFTAIIICGMLVNWLHWVGAWVLVTLSGNS